jgi:hypothetical protein
LSAQPLVNVPSTQDQSYIPLFVGIGSAANTLGFATGDDYDSTNFVIGNFVNYSSPSYVAIPGGGIKTVGGNYINTSGTFQATAFNWYGVFTEYNVAIVAVIGGGLTWIAGGALRPWRPSNQRGIGTAPGAIAATDTSVQLTQDVSARMQPGQKVFIINQGHNSVSGNFAQTQVLTVLTAVPSLGGCLVTFTGEVGVTFDAGALVGAVTPNYTTTGVFDNTVSYLSHNDDSSCTPSSSGEGNSGSPDNGVVTGSMNYSAPTKQEQLWAGELDLPVYQTGASWNGTVGFHYGIQEFDPGSPVAIANGDAFGDGGTLQVWKAFLGNNACCLGPFTNPANTSSSGWTPEDPPPWLP